MPGVSTAVDRMNDRLSPLTGTVLVRVFDSDLREFGCFDGHPEGLYCVLTVKFYQVEA
jgi:hypothetical protein